MEILRAALGLDPVGFRMDPALLELHYGHWEGHLASELPDTILRVLRESRLIHSAGGQQVARAMPTSWSGPTAGSTPWNGRPLP